MRVCVCVRVCVYTCVCACVRECVRVFFFLCRVCINGVCTCPHVQWGVFGVYAQVIRQIAKQFPGDVLHKMPRIFNDY